MSKLKKSIVSLYSGKKILILGMGKEGRSSLEFLKELLPEQKISIMDLSDKVEVPDGNNQHVTLLFGEETYLKNLKTFDVIFKTPSISLNDQALKEYRDQGGVITSQLNEFLRVYAAQTIGVTGTKGKSTTTAFIHHVLHLAGKNIVMAGNIGIPPFEVDELWSDESLVVMEMSSYQLETVTFSPHWAIWLNIFSEHLNFHGSLDRYVKAKGNITTYQSPEDYFIFNSTSREIENISLKSLAVKLPFQPLENEAELKEIVGSLLESKLSKIFLLDDLPAVLQLMKLLLIDIHVVIEALQTFKPLPHRLEKITTKSGVIFVDDTLATIPEATVAAIHAFPTIRVILLGGFDRGIGYDLVVDEVMKKKIPIIIFFKPSGEKMHQILQAKYPESEWPKIFFVDSMEEAVKLAYANTKAQDIVLLSPASPSFGQYKDYQDKAAQFRSWILECDH